MGAAACRSYLSVCLVAVTIGIAVGATSAPSQPQGLGPQHLWPTPAAFVVPPPLSSKGAQAKWLEILAAHVQALSSDAGPDRGSWQSAGKSFIEDCVAVGGTAAAAGAALRRHVEAAATSYFREALAAKAPTLVDRVQVRLEHSWAHLVRGQEVELPHVHARAALAGTLYLRCGDAAPDDAAQPRCGIFLEDPRTPAGTADMPESLRRRLGWGEVQSFRLSPGSLVLHPAWLQHAALPPEPTVDSSREALLQQQSLGISFTAVVQLKDLASEPKSGAKPRSRISDDLDAPSDEL